MQALGLALDIARFLWGLCHPGPEPAAPAAARREAPPARCEFTCEHGSGCCLMQGHRPADRHVTEHGCVVYDNSIAEMSRYRRHG